MSGSTSAARLDPVDAVAGVLALGEGVQGAHVPAAQLAGQLGGAQDVGGLGDLLVVVVGQLALRRAADAAAVEQVGAGPVEAPEVGGAARCRSR